MKSVRLYSLVTKHWPRIAAGLVVLIGLVELVVGGLTADSGLEFYLLAWAATTGGLWFLFEKAEKALSEESRERVDGWVQEVDLREAFSSIPRGFAFLFDRIFTERHLSARCFFASCVASVAAAAVVSSVWYAFTWPMERVVYSVDSEFYRVSYDLSIASLLSQGGALLVFALMFNAVPDFVSLLQTRLLIRWMDRTGRLVRFVVLDVVLTAVLSLLVILFAARLAFVVPAPTASEPSSGLAQGAVDLLTFAPATARLEIPILTVAVTSEVIALDSADAEVRTYADRVRPYSPELTRYLTEFEQTTAIPASLRDPLLTDMTAAWNRAFERVWSEEVVVIGGVPQVRVGVPFGIFFYTAFFTSVWLWLYAASILLSRVLIEMDRGVGFLLRVTDVENQPFRSIGFVSVLIVSGLFALGLPFVLL